CYTCVAAAGNGQLLPNIDKVHICQAAGVGDLLRRDTIFKRNAIEVVVANGYFMYTIGSVDHSTASANRRGRKNGCSSSGGNPENGLRGLSQLDTRRFGCLPNDKGGGHF